MVRVDKILKRQRHHKNVCCFKIYVLCLVTTESLLGIIEILTKRCLVLQFRANWIVLIQEINMSL